VAAMVASGHKSEVGGASICLLGDMAVASNGVQEFLRQKVKRPQLLRLVPSQQPPNEGPRMQL